MAFHDELKIALVSTLGKRKVVFQSKWDRLHSSRWRGAAAKPVALVLHHTAGAATDSTDPANPGNKKGANKGVIDFIQSHYEVPAANFTLDRDGTVYVHAAYPIWHAGLGTFKNKKPWSSLAIPDNLGNNYMLGVEVVSKGLKKDFTEAQKESLVLLLKACAKASDWPNTNLVRRPRHKDWTTRKIDIIYENAEVAVWIKKSGV
jgi:N-acetyl-anhydromuramyl-L-alanine amidase AmpD